MPVASGTVVIACEGCHRELAREPHRDAAGRPAGFFLDKLKCACEPHFIRVWVERERRTLHERLDALLASYLKEYGPGFDRKTFLDFVAAWEAREP